MIPILPRLKKALGFLALGACAVGVQAQNVLFSDNFESDTSENWEVLGDSSDGTPDFTVQFNFDYSTNAYTFNGQQRTIPVAPGAAGTRGVKIAVNKDDVAAIAAANIFPKGQVFSGNYALKFDMWIGYNGGRTGGSGSTEFGIFGINHSGTQVSWDVSGVGGDGIWFGVTGEGGAARDFRSYEFDGSAVIERRGLDAGLIGADDGEATFQERFPLPDFETPGVPGKSWAQVEVYQLNGNLVWKINGYVIAERPNTAPATEGTIMLGAMDVFSSIANPRQDNFVIFDNVRVVSLPETPLPTVSIATLDEIASEPGTDTASFTVTRTGDDLSSALAIRYRVTGTAEAGTDIETPSGTVTIPAGASEATLEIKALNDTLGEGDETAIITLLGTENYELRADISAIATIVDDGDTSTVNLLVADANAYEKNTGDTAAFRVVRSGDVSQNLTVNLQLSGTAVSGIDFESVPANVQIEAGVESALVVIRPRDNAVIDANRTVMATLQAGVRYILGTNTTGTVTIRNDDIAPAQSVTFSENFQTDVSESWNINSHSPGNNSAEFGFDYSAVGIPPAPNTTDATTLGLKLQANNGETGLFTGISVSPKDLNLEGDYRLRFDMWNNFVGPLPAGGTGSTMMFSTGIGTDGTVAQFPGTSVQGVLFAASGDGGTASDYRAYRATGAPINATNNVYAAGTTDAALNNTNPYYSVFGGRTAPENQLALYPSQTGATSAGALGIAWHEVVVTKVGTVVTWDIDNLRIATVDLGDKQISSNIFVGYFDINAGQSGNQELSFGLVDNLRVEQLNSVTPPPQIAITSTTVSAGLVTIRFTSTSGAASSFKLVSSTEVAGPYTEIAATVTEVSPGVFQATVTSTDPHRFFRILHQ